MEENIAFIYDRYVDDLYTYGLYLGFKREIVMDAIHDVFCKLSENKEILASIESCKFYLFKSLKNRLYDILKKEKPYIELSDIESQTLPFSFSINIEDNFINKEDQRLIKEQITEMLSVLTPRQREIIYLRYIQEYEYSEISELLNISIHGCRKLVSKAILKLREEYGTLITLLLLS